MKSDFPAIGSVKPWVFVCLGLSLYAGRPQAAVFQEADGQVVVEAENFTAQSLSEVRKWYRIGMQPGITPAPDLDPSHALTAAGQAYMEILPDTRVTDKDVLIGATETTVPANANFSDFQGKMAVIEYSVEFKTAGKYYVWARMYSSGGEDNSLHVGIDGTWPASGRRMQWCEGKNAWAWASAQRTEAVHCGVPGAIFLEVKTPGLHTISFSMREDGVELDRWLMTTQANLGLTSAVGPEQSKYTGELTDGGGSVTEFTVLKATGDFPTLAVPGFIAPYKDAAQNALAINAAVVANRGKFAAAEAVFAGAAGTYDLTLVTLGETDGECTYRVSVGGTLVGEATNKPAAADYGEQQHVFKAVTLAKNAVIRVEFNTHSNGKTPEAGGFAWARGRWTSLILAKAASTALRRPGRFSGAYGKGASGSGAYGSGASGGGSSGSGGKDQASQAAGADAYTAKGERTNPGPGKAAALPRFLK